MHASLLLLALLLIVVSAIQPLAARLRVSSSLILALIGIGTALGARLLIHADPSGVPGAIAAAVADFSLGSEAFLYIFLPLLLFQSALTIEVKRMIEDAAPILLLAVVAVLVSTFVIGYALAPFTPVSPIVCLMLGAIVATTDPVAVIEIFRDVGAPSRLRRLVEGESLLNDAAAITLFTLLVDMLVGGHEASVGAAVVTFIKTFVGGIAVGYVGARAIAALSAWLTDFRLAQVTLTLALPYVVYITGEHTFHVSGVVAAVTAGLTLTAVGQPRTPPVDWRSMHELWEQLAFWASSLIFILASLRVPALLESVGWHDALLLLVLVVAALVARAVVLWGFIPALTAMKLSQRVDHRFRAVILWGGLRGAVTLALALAVTESDRIDPAARDFIAVLATGFVLFTLVVQGPTLRMLIGVLKLNRLSPFDVALRTQVLAISHGRVAEVVRTVGRHYQFDAALVNDVALTYADPGATNRRARIDPAAIDRSTEDDRLKLGLVALSTRERELALEQLEARTVSPGVIEELVGSIGRMIDRTRAGGLPAYLKAAHQLVGFSRRFKFALAIHRRLRTDAPLVDALADRFERLLASRIILDELAPFIDETLAALLGERVTPLLKDALGQRQDMTASALEALGAQYPKYAALLERQFLNKIGLRRKDVEHRALFEHQVIGPELYGTLQRELQSDRRSAESRPKLDLGLETRALIAQVPMFAALNPQQLDAVARLLVARFAVPGEVLIREGDRGDAMYFISSGRVEVRVGERAFMLSRGDFFGEMALLLQQRRQADVSTVTYCQLLVLYGHDFQDLLRRTPRLKKEIDSIAAERAEMNERG